MTLYNPQLMRQRLLQALESQGYSMRRASLEAGLSETFLHGVIKLGRDPGVMNLTKVCDLLDLSLGYIMYGHDIGRDEEEILSHLQAFPTKRQAILALLRA